MQFWKWLHTKTVLIYEPVAFVAFKESEWNLRSRYFNVRNARRRLQTAAIGGKLYTSKGHRSRFFHCTCLMSRIFITHLSKFIYGYFLSSFTDFITQIGLPYPYFSFFYNFFHIVLAFHTNTSTHYNLLKSIKKKQMMMIWMRSLHLRIIILSKIIRWLGG